MWYANTILFDPGHNCLEETDMVDHHSNGPQ